MLKVALIDQHALYHEMRIMLLERFDDVAQWDIGVCSMISNVLQVSISQYIIRLEDRIVHSVKGQGFDVESLTQGAIERGRGFHPSVIQEQFGVAMVDEDVGSHEHL